MNNEIRKMIGMAIDSYMHKRVKCQIQGTTGNSIEYINADMPEINLIATYVAPSVANMKHKVVIYRYRYKMLSQIVTMYKGRSPNMWMIERTTDPTSSTHYKPLVSINYLESNKAKPMTSIKPWTLADTNRLLNMFAIQTSAVDPEEITYDSLVEQFGKDAFERSEKDINERLALICTTLHVNKGILSEVQYAQASMLDDFRNKLKEWDVKVWAGDWIKQEPPKKLTLDELITDFKIMSLGTQISMSKDDLEKLVDFLQG